MNNLMMQVVHQRHKLGLTVLDVAYKSGLPWQSIYQFEANAVAGRTCLLSTLERLAAAVDMTVTVSSESKVGASAC